MLLESLFSGQNVKTYRKSFQTHLHKDVNAYVMFGEPTRWKSSLTINIVLSISYRHLRLETVGIMGGLLYPLCWGMGKMAQWVEEKKADTVQKETSTFFWILLYDENLSIFYWEEVLLFCGIYLFFI